MSPRETLSYVVTIVAAVVILILGVHFSLWGIAGDDPVVVTLASFSLGLIVLLGGERKAVGERLVELQRDVGAKVDAWRRSSPEIHSITRFETCDDALRDLVKCIPRANVILNTRISRDNIKSGDAPHGDYLKALKAALVQGARIVDIVSPGFNKDVEELATFAKNPDCAGEYTHYECNETAPSFINFCILQRRGNGRELWLGWATSRRVGMEQPAFSIRDQGVVSYFKTYHESLRG